MEKVDLKLGWRAYVLIWLLGFVTHEHHLPGYMNRFWIFIKRKKTGIQIRLHHILRSDDDRALHDHPWWYISLIISGGYWEVTVYELDDWRNRARIADVFTQDGIQHKKKWYGPWSIIFKKATHLHRLILPEGKSAWTLFICGAKSKEWGFMTEKGWIKWDEYESPEEVAYHKGYD